MSLDTLVGSVILLFALIGFVLLIVTRRRE